MATISKTCYDTYRVQVRRVGQPSITKTFKSKHEAELWSQRIEFEISSGVFINRTEAERVSFAELIDRYLTEVSPLKKGHKQEVPRLLGLKRTIGQYRVLQIQSKHIAKYRDARLKDGKSGSTILNELSLISQVFDTAIKEWSLPIHGNPCSLIKKPKPAQGRERRLSNDEEYLLLANCRASRAILLHSLVIMALETGMRLGELLSLTWNNIDLIKRVAYLPITKNGEKRTVPLSTKSIHTLNNISRNISSNRVFWTWSAKDGVANVWRRTCLKSGIKDLHLAIN